MTTYELPRGYKLKRKPQYIKGKKYNEVYACIKAPKKYKFSDEDIEYINHHCIKTEDGLRLTKNKSGGLYINDFDVTKKKINTKKFVEAMPQKFLNALRKFRNI